MKKILIALLTLGALMTVSQAEMKCAAGKCGAAMKQASQSKTMNKPKKMMSLFQAVPKDKAILLQEGKAKAFCPQCGMTLPMFYKTNHAATVNGKVKQYCSIHCLAEEMLRGAKPTDIKVVDVATLKFIPVDKAFYVVGSHKKGTMTMVSKYAFGSKADAEAFAKANGGKITDFKGALGAAKAEFEKDSKMIAKKQAMMAKKGAMLYANKCQKSEEKFASTAEAKAYIISHKLCEGLNGKQLQAVGLYLYHKH